MLHWVNHKSSRSCQKCGLCGAHSTSSSVQCSVRNRKVWEDRRAGCISPPWEFRHRLGRGFLSSLWLVQPGSVLTQSRHLNSILNDMDNGGLTLEPCLWIVALFHSWNSSCSRGWIWGRDSQRRLDWASLCRDWRCHLVPRVKPKWSYRCPVEEERIPNTLLLFAPQMLDLQHWVKREGHFLGLYCHQG